MLPRICTYLLAVAAGVCHAQAAHASPNLDTPLELASLEWLVADSGAIVRGVVVDVTTDQNWNIVTRDVGAKAERLKFTVYKFDKGDAALAQSQQSKSEMVWILKRHGTGVPGQAPEREMVLARHKIELYAPFLPGRPGEPALSVIPLGTHDAKLGLSGPALLTMDLRILKTPDEIVQAIRTAVAQTPATEPVRSHAVSLPKEIAQRTGFSRAQNLLTAPLDGRLEELARRLVQSPGDFLAKGDPDLKQPLRLEGVKTLRLFRTERNLALVRAGLDDPNSNAPFKDDRHTLVPAFPKSQETKNKITLPVDLAHVPEINFQRPLTKAMKTTDAQLHTAVTIDSVHLMNQKKTDAFIEGLMSQRHDLAGLSFAMGDACRMKPEVGRQFVAALDIFRKSEDAVRERSEKSKEGPAEQMMQYYKTHSAAKNVEPSASVAALMQVLGHEDGNTRLGLAKYLDGLPSAEATHALAKLAIFSAEPEVRAAALAALKKRDAEDYSEILVAGLKYPWPAVAERATEAMAKLGRKDLVPQLIGVLENPDPRAPQTREVDGNKVSEVRELVRLNHHHNCLLCHAPATTNRDGLSKEDAAKLEGLTAQVPVPSESMVAYYRPDSPDILVRFDVTYLRQDFSLKLPVANADPWPELQRYDFLVRTRTVTEQEAATYQELLQPKGPDAMSPYRRAAQAALRELTGQDAGPSAAAWRKLTEL